MKISEATTKIKANSVLKDSDGYFLIRGYMPEYGWYTYIECDKNGNPTDYGDGVLMPFELIGATIIRLFMEEE